MHSRAPRSPRTRLRSFTSLLAITGLALMGAVAITAAAPAAPANAAEPLPICPPDGEAPPIGPLPTYTDSNVAVYVGGDYLATSSAAESEGLLLVRGNATFDKTSGGVFNVGAVGAGSGIVPAGGGTMLAVGGDLVVGPTTNLHVGANITGGGAVKVGGTSTGTVDTNGAGIETGLGQAAAMDPNADFQTVITDTSAEIAGYPVTGTGLVAGNQVQFVGTPGDDPQVFTLDTGAISAITEISFTALPADVPIVINVTGTDDVAFSPNYFAIDGVRVDDLTSPVFGNAASRILWNFTDTTSLLIGGTSQFMGSILAPTADAEITASTNGRVHIGGDLTTRGAGNEQHNYPWTGGGSLGCQQVGGFSAAKDVTGPAAGDVPADTEFTLEYSYELGGETITGQLTLLADGTVVDGPQDLPVGTVVDFDEIDLPVIPGVSWGTPAISPEQVTIGDDENTLVTVTNPTESGTLMAGGFSLAKSVGGDAAAAVPAETSFTVEYRYELDGTTTTGRIAVLADGTVSQGPQDLPTGTVVSFTEVDLPEIDGVEWGEPTFSPETVTISTDEDVLVTVTNTAGSPDGPGPGPDGGTDTPTDGDGDLAETGVTGIAAAIAGAAALLAAGVALLLVRRRRTA
ncbi:choice-of-anchor A family protein [Agromyces sp. NPDC057679]|uniref:choice-of-anchor A family protein n=1 Tax=Agromyces sp. NPDC057679 TaxID=3346207 RepID=UPI003671EFC2